jgi:hypothetical protein
VNGTLHPIDNATGQPLITYSAEKVTHDESGYIIVRAVSDSAVTNRIWIKIVGPLSKIVSAVTADTNGNGYLDRIDLRFDLPVSLADSTALQHFFVVYKGDTLRAVRLVQTDTAGKAFSVILQEKRTVDPQTSWTPRITIRNANASLRNADTLLQITADDGAGPVVWSVTKFVENVTDRTTDRVRVVFSEPILDTTGASFSLGSATPSQLFDVWYRSGSGMELQDSILRGISSFTLAEPNAVEFLMSNGADLKDYHWLSIKTDTSGTAPRSEIFDASPARNFPVPGNVPVQTVIKGTIGKSMTIGPNPFPPISFHQETELTAHDEKVLISWIRGRNGGGGTILKVTLSMPSDPVGVRLTGELRVYDLAGNLVYLRKNDNDLIPAKWRSTWYAGSRDICFYWNGLNDKGMRCAAGAYRTILQVAFITSDKTTRQTYTGTAGVAR